MLKNHNFSLDGELPNVGSRQDFDLAHGSLSDTTTIKNRGLKLFRQRWWAMFVKKLIHSKRYKFSLISQLLMPCLFTMLSLITVRSFPKLTDEPSILLTPNMFASKTNAIYHSNDYLAR